MNMRLRTDVLALYRWFFTLVFLSLGVAGLVVVTFHFTNPALLEQYLSVNINQPLWMSVAIGSLLSLICGLITARFCFERRQVKSDRRYRQRNISFPDRRGGRDRRTGKLFHY